MERDLRDPTTLGEVLLKIRALVGDGKLTLAAVCDRHAGALETVSDYDLNPGVIEKYGDPRTRGDAWVARNLP